MYVYIYIYILFSGNYGVSPHANVYMCYSYIYIQYICIIHTYIHTYTRELKKYSRTLEAINLLSGKR